MSRVARISTFCLWLLAFVAMGGIARAQDAGTCSPGGDAGICDGGLDDGGFGGNPTDAGSSVPLACGGALCDTTNGSGCSSAGKSDLSLMMVVAVGTLALAIGRRRILRGSLGTEQSQ